MPAWLRLGTLFLAPLALLGCFLTPGKFVSSLRIDADRNFTFAYKGEVIAVDPSKNLNEELRRSGPDEDRSDNAAEQDQSADDPVPQRLRSDDNGKTSGKSNADTEIKNRAIAAALSKEYGYRSVVYVGQGKFLIDYAVSGTLTHNFTFPFNADAEVLLPFVMIELRQGGLVRVKAPGFANETTKSATPAGIGSPPSLLDGMFTLDTNASIVSQNNEDGAKASDGRSVISWRATPLSKDAPTAVLRLPR